MAVPTASSGTGSVADTPRVHQLIRTQLERISGSPEFAGAPRLRQFLSFVIDMALAGKGDQIKESLIAVEVYGRRPDYNPQIDSTVRVEASRLRTRLRQFYERSGAGEIVEIELPKGAYVPVFQVRPSEAEPVNEPPRPGVLSLHWQRGLAGAACLVVVLAAVAIAVRQESPRASSRAAVAIDSVAVLPFANLSNEPEMERFCDGLTEELTTRTAGIPGLRVPARRAMLRYRNQPVKLIDVGRAEGVRALLEGSVRRDGDRFLITSQLIDAHSGYHLWAETMERRSGDAMELQQELAGRIAAALEQRIRGVGGQRWEENIAPATQESYLRAWELLRLRIPPEAAPGVPKSVRESVALFERVTRESPGFGRGWAGLAEATEYAYELDVTRVPSRLAAAKTAARRALQLDSNLADAHSVLCSIALYREWKISEAEEACRRVIDLNPRNPVAYRRHIEVLRIQGRQVEAVAEVNRALTLDPASPVLQLQKAMLLYDAGQYDSAAAHAAALANTYGVQKAVWGIATWLQGLCEERRGRLAEAEKLFRTGLTEGIQSDSWNEPALAHVLARMRRTDEAEEIGKALERQVAQGKPRHYALALLHTALGQPGAALAWLERGMAERDPSVLFLAIEKRFEPIRSDRRFQALLEEVRGTYVPKPS